MGDLWSGGPGVADPRLALDARLPRLCLAKNGDNRWWRRAQPVHEVGEPAHAEAFYGLAHREQTVGDIMRQVARNGADPPALLREGERVRSPSLLDLATNLLNRRTQESTRQED